MVEIISRLSGIFKVSALPLLLLTTIGSTKVNIREEKKLRTEDTVPGDNFPHLKGGNFQ